MNLSSRAEIITLHLYQRIVYKGIFVSGYISSVLYIWTMNVSNTLIHQKMCF